MRKNFVFFVLIPLLIVLVVTYFFIDRWVESGLEAGGDAVVGAKVEIDNLKVTFSPIGMEWEKIQVTNPNDTWRNFFETGKVKFALDFGQLLRNKYIIETMEVNNLLIGTKRATDGAIPDADRKPAEAAGSSTFTSLAKEALATTVEQTPVFNIDNLRKGINADSLVKALDIRTLKYIDSMKQQVTAASGQWNASLGDFENSKKKLTEIETNVKAINPAELKSIDKITSAISTIDNSIKSVNDIKKTFDDRKASITADVQRLSGAVGAVDDVVKQDFQKLLGMAKLPNLNTNGIAQLLVGQEMYNRAMSYLSWVDLARSHIKKYSPEPQEEKSRRMKGQNIHFPVAQAYPKFWIQKVLISGGAGETPAEDYIRAKGEAKNITNDQTVTGVPLTIDLQGVEGGGREFTLGALFDRTKDVPFDQYKASLAGVPLSEFQLGRADFLPTKVTDATMSSSLSISVPGNQFDATTQLELRNLKLQFEAEPKNVIERLIRDVLQGISAIDVGLRLWTTGGGFNMALSTNLAEQIASRVKDVLGAEFAKLQSDLRAKLDDIVKQKKQEFEKLYAAKKADVEKQVQAYQSLVDEKIAMVETKKKELTERLEKEKKGKVMAY